MDPANETQAPEATEVEEPTNAEHEAVVCWRLSQMLSLGIGELEAEVLAESNADLGLLRRIIGQGCPPPLAVQIVL
ncbi:MAG: hypothetical protein E6G14_04350 [Actinobacteria bacterium]|nr:MAG: hypothetical protein E6G14_04350 [Actinomycetota bacterium]